MFGRDTLTPKPKKAFEPRPWRTIAIDEVHTPIPQLGTPEPYYESYFWWINPENTVTLEDIATLYEYQRSKDIIYHTPSEKPNPAWHTQYPPSNKHSTQCFEIPMVSGGNKR